MAFSARPVLEHFGKNIESGRCGFVSKVLFHLMHAILREKRFESMEELLQFCAKADNLGPWLPSEKDRATFSLGLRDSLLALLRPAGPACRGPQCA